MAILLKVASRDYVVTLSTLVKRVYESFIAGRVDIVKRRKLEMIGKLISFYSTV